MARAVKIPVSLLFVLLNVFWCDARTRFLIKLSNDGKNTNRLQKSNTIYHSTLNQVRPIVNIPYSGSLQNLHHRFPILKFENQPSISGQYENQPPSYFSASQYNSWPFSYLTSQQKKRPLALKQYVKPGHFREMINAPKLRGPTRFNPISLIRHVGSPGQPASEMNIRNFVKSVDNSKNNTTKNATKEIKEESVKCKCGVRKSVSIIFPKGVFKNEVEEIGSILMRSAVVNGPNLSNTRFNEYSGQPKISLNRITYGVLTSNREAPWQVAMFVNGRFHCGASIISERFVLTAAHCVSSFRNKPEKLKLSLGDWDLETVDDGMNVEAKVSNIIVHPQFNYFNLRNDIAILNLSKIIEFNDRITPICLPPEDVEIEGSLMTVTGWGRNEDNLLQKKLHKLRAVALENSICSRRWVQTGAPENLIDNSTVCMDTQYGDSCKGDSGGPAILEHPAGSQTYVLAGIVSFGSGSCTDANLPGVYTRVSSYITWIEENTT